MNKKIKIISSMFIILIMILIIIKIYDKPKASKDGNITITLMSDNNTVISEKELSFSKNDTFQQLLENNYDIEYYDQTMIVKIDELTTSNVNEYFILIIVNCQISNYGVTNIKLHDGDKIKFIYTRIGDYSYGC